MNFKELLVEMSVVCSKTDGFGFIARINSNDHSPPHIHITSTSGEKICKLQVTKHKPKTKNDLTFLKIDNQELLNQISKNLVKWINTDTKYGLDRWLFLKETWDSYHTNDALNEVLDDSGD